MDLEGDPEGLGILYELNARGRHGQDVAQRGQIKQGLEFRAAARTRALDARKRETEAAAKHKEGGGLFNGFKKLASHVVSNVTHLRAGRLASDLCKDTKATLDVTDPQFWSDVGAVAKVYGKLVGVACATALSVLSAGTFAVACAVAVAVCMATSVAMEECKLADALDLSTELRLGISISCAVVATAATLGAGAASACAETTSIAAARALGGAAEGAGMGAEGGALVAAASFAHTLSLLGADSKQAQNRVRQTTAQLNQEVKLLAAISDSYEKSQSVLVDAIATQQDTRNMILNGARA